MIASSLFILSIMFEEGRKSGCLINLSLTQIIQSKTIYIYLAKIMQTKTIYISLAQIMQTKSIYISLMAMWFAFCGRAVLEWRVQLVVAGLARHQAQGSQRRGHTDQPRPHHKYGRRSKRLLKIFYNFFSFGFFKSRYYFKNQTLIGMHRISLVKNKG